MEGRIVLGRKDALRLRSLLSAQRSRVQDREHLEDLEHELDRAVLVEGDTPQDRVTVNSTVMVRDLDSDLRRMYTLVLPAEADATQGRISVLAPLGTALLGCRVHEQIEWQMPSGRHRLHIEAVRPRQMAGHELVETRATPPV